MSEGKKQPYLDGSFDVTITDCYLTKSDTTGTISIYFNSDVTGKDFVSKTSTEKVDVSYSGIGFYFALSANTAFRWKQLESLNDGKPVTPQMIVPPDGSKSPFIGKTVKARIQSTAKSNKNGDEYIAYDVFFNTGPKAIDISIAEQIAELDKLMLDCGYVSGGGTAGKPSKQVAKPKQEKVEEDTSFDPDTF